MQPCVSDIFLERSRFLFQEIVWPTRSFALPNQAMQVSICGRTATPWLINSTASGRFSSSRGSRRPLQIEKTKT
jgi:hypothetical protein